jgi:hypothetical protein
MVCSRANLKLILIIGYVALNGWMIVDELGRIWREVVMVDLKSLFIVFLERPVK